MKTNKEKLKQLLDKREELGYSILDEAPNSKVSMELFIEIEQIEEQIELLAGKTIEEVEKEFSNDRG